jgi:DNA-binding CsgD family transcriptional regulator/tetratricopeptide (TPR) repeat protein
MGARLLGRDVELALLTQAIEDVQSGHGRTVLLSGEAGIGKSRLAAETLAIAGEQGFSTLQGQAHPLHAGLAYAPIVESIRRYLASLSESTSARLLDGLADLGRLLVDPRLPAAESLGEPELERTRMFEAVTRLIRRIAERAPVLLFIDDLHWADRGTVELLHYIGRGVADRRVLVLAGYRPSETSDALAELAVAARRARPDGELEVLGLSETASADLVHELLGHQPSPELLQGVLSRARGVPLFITALVQGSGPLRPEALPTIVRDAVLSRLQRLNDPERRLLELVAVAGNTGSTEVLRAAWTGTEREFLRTLRKLHTEGLITEHATPRQVTYRVAHPLYAEVAYGELTLGERRHVHAQLAEIINTLTPDDVLALAPHYRDAGDLVDAARAIEVLADAGWRALGVFAADEAEQYLGAALAGARETGPPSLLLSLLNGLGETRQSVGDLEGAASAWQESAALSERSGDQELRRTLNHRLSLLESERGDLAAALRHARGETGESSDSVLLHLVFAMRTGDSAEAQAMVDRLITLAETTGTDVAYAAAQTGRSLMAMYGNDFVTALTAAERALDLSRRCEDESPVHAQSVRRALVGLSMLAGDMTAAIAYAEASTGKQASFILPSGHCSGQVALAAACYVAGDLDSALQAIDTGVGLARRAGLGRSLYRTLLCRAFLLIERGRSGEANACVAEAKESFPAGDASTDVLTELVDATLALHNGRPERTPPTPRWFVHDEQFAVGVGLLFAGRSALAAGDTERAAKAIGLLRQVGRTAPFLAAHADRLDGLSRGEPGLLDSAATRLHAMGARLLAAQTRLEWAELVADADAAAACLEIFEQAGASPWTDRARRLARSLGVRVPVARGTGKLSNRETQVVGLVGEGLSNADIASRLFVSERTVETHLRNAYAKLGLTSRIALARWSADTPG